MELVSSERFGEWASGRGISLKKWGPNYANGQDRFWNQPENASAWPYFVAHLLSALGPWSDCWIWPRDGGWNYEVAPDAGVNEFVNTSILRGACVPLGLIGALLASSAEETNVLTIAFARMAFGWCQDDDLVLIPDHGRFIVEIHHHAVAKVGFAREEDVAPFVSYMAEIGVDLPSRPPDGTFDWEPWMIDRKT